MPAKMFNQFICSSLMLPEHREALNRHNLALGEQEKKMRRPCIAEQQRELWDRLLHDSLHQGKELMVTTTMNEKDSQLLKGVVCKIDPLQQEIRIKAGGNVRRVPVGSVVAVESVRAVDK